MEVNQIQQQLFQAIKSRLPADASVVDETAKLLGISTDSAYRRMRGEKQVTLEELYSLCSHYKISLDQLMNIQTGAYLFQGNILDYKTFRYDAYLTGIMHQMGYINSFKEKEFFYLCKDCPIFHYFHFKEFASFKYHVWMSSLMYFPEFQNRKVAFEEYPEELFRLGTQILGIYNQIDSVELWNIESINSTWRQIDFYRDSGLFKSEADIALLYDCVGKLMDHLEEQAELGYKFTYGDPEKKPLGRYKMYFNELVLGDNNILAIMDNSKVVFIPHTAINYMMTRDVTFCDKFHQYL